MRPREAWPAAADKALLVETTVKLPVQVRVLAISAKSTPNRQ